MTRMLPFLLLATLSSPDGGLAVDLRIRGPASTTCFSTVRRHVAKLPEARRVHWLAGDGTPVLRVFCGNDVRLSLRAVRKALADASAEMRELTSIEISYDLDAEATAVPDGSVIVREEATEKAKPGTNLAELLKDASISDVRLQPRTTADEVYACPAGCSEGASAGHCPECVTELAQRPRHDCRSC